MRSNRWAAVAVLMLLSIAGTASGQCLSEVRQIGSGDTGTDLVAGPAAWSGSMLAIASNQVRDDSVSVTLYDESGNVLYRAVRIPSSDDAKIFDVLWNGDDFGVFYRSDAGKLVFARVSTIGKMVGSEKVLLPAVTLGATDEVDVIWDHTLESYVIARTVNAPSPSLWLTFVNADGVVTRNVSVATPAPDSFVHMAIADDDVIGVFFENGASRNVGMLTWRTGDPDPVRTVWSPGEDLVVAADGDDFVLARTVLADGRRSIRWKIIDDRGRDLRDETRLLIGPGKDVAVVSLLAQGDELALAYLESRDGFDTDAPSYRLRRFTRDGNIISDTLFAAAESVRHRAVTEYDFVWTGRSYVTAAVRETAEIRDSFFLRFCPLNAHVSAPRTIARGSTLTLTGTAGGGIPPYTYLWSRGDIPLASGETFQQTFNELGTFAYTLNVTDATGTMAAQTVEITVYEPEPPPPPPANRRRRSVRH